MKKLSKKDLDYVAGTLSCGEFSDLDPDEISHAELRQAVIVYLEATENLMDMIDKLKAWP